MTSWLKAYLSALYEGLAFIFVISVIGSILLTLIYGALYWGGAFLSVLVHDPDVQAAAPVVGMLVIIVLVFAPVVGVIVTPRREP